MTIPKISFCIPTYNRELFLDELIKSIIIQCTEEFAEQIEICIADNASTDNTSVMIEEWRQKTTVNIVYFKNTENIGPDRNYLKAVSLATADYCWLFGSDDTLAPSALESMLQNINSNYDIYLVNRMDCDHKMNPMYQTYLLSKEQSSQAFNLSIPSGFIDYMKHGTSIGALFTYLSSIIIRRKCWESVEIDNSFIGSAYSHSYIILKYISQNSTTLFYEKRPFVLCRQGNDHFMQEGFAKRALIDLIGYKKLADTIFFNQPDVKRSILKLLYKTRPSITTLALSRLKSSDEVWNKYEPEFKKFYSLILVKVIAKIKPIISIVYQCKKQIFK